MEVTILKPRSLKTSIELHGVLASSEKAVIKVEFAAPVLAILAEEGEQISRGQPLLRLDTSKMALQFQQVEHLREQSQADLESARLKLSRLRALASSNVIPAQQLDDARLNHKSTAARVKELESRLQMIRRDIDKQVVKSPMDAIVGTHHVEVGESTVAYQALITLHSVRTMQVSVYVSEEQLPFVRVGNAAWVKTVLGEIDSAIHSISAAADPRTGNYELRLLLENRDSRLKPGMTAEVLLQAIQFQDQLVIPDTALVAWEGRHVVFIANGNTAERRNVELSIASDDHLIVTSGLSQGEWLITKGARQVTEGSLIELSTGSPQ